MSQSVELVDQDALDRGVELIGEMGRRFGEIIAGTRIEREASELFVSELTRIGVRTEVHTLPALVSEPGEGRLEVLGGGAGASQAIPCAVFAQSEPTLAEGVEADVVYIGAGGIEDYPPDAVEGKIALTELSYAPARPEKARIAKERGALGLLMANWGGDDNPAVPKGTVKCVWGNPTRRDLPKITTLPAVGIARRDLVGLRDAAEGEGLRVRLTTQVRREWRQVTLPVGWVDAPHAGTEREFVLVAGHYDSWGGGVTDNHSGNVGKLLIAEALHRARDGLCRDVAIAFWPAHESGIMAGSTWFVDSFWDLLAEGCVAHLNVDSLGMRNSAVWHVDAAAELTDLVRSVSAAAPARPLVLTDRPAKVGDQSFLGLGIPSLMAQSRPSPEQVVAENGAILNWWYHSDFDTVDKLDPESFAYDTRVLTDCVARLATEPVLPFSAGSVAQEIVDRLAQLEAICTEHGLHPDTAGLGWSSLVDEALALRERCVALDAGIAELHVAGADGERVACANAWLRALARITSPTRYTAVHRHDQDTYGESRLHHTLPELGVVGELAAASGDAKHVLWTEAARARNRLMDALRDANRRAGEAERELLRT